MMMFLAIKTERTVRGWAWTTNLSVTVERANQLLYGDIVKEFPLIKWCGWVDEIKTCVSRFRYIIVSCSKDMKSEKLGELGLR